MIKKLWPLAIGGLALGATEFLIMGLLRVIGEDMGLTDAITGRFISAYAIGVVVGAPTLIALAAEYNPKKILLFFMVLFTLFNGLSAFSYRIALEKLSHLIEDHYRHRFRKFSGKEGA